MPTLDEELSQLLGHIEALEIRLASPAERGGFGAVRAGQAPASPPFDLQLETMRLTVRALQALTSSIGECQMEDPYANIRYVFKDGKQYRCCMHNPPHCFEIT